MGIKKKTLGPCKKRYSIKKMLYPVDGYYKRYFHMINMNLEEMDHVESFYTMKKWCKGQVLDIGCGLGYLTNYLGGCGVDKNEKIISIARELYSHLNFYVWDNSYTITNERFDTIVCYNLIEHIPEAERFNLFKEINWLLKKNGRVIFGYANPYNLLQFLKGFFSKSALFDSTHIYNWPIKQFEQIIADAFNIVEIKKTSPFTKCIWFSKYFKGDILILCSVREQEK